MDTNTTYNGWSNKATWQVNLWMGDYFNVLANESDWSENIEDFANELEQVTWDSLNELGATKETSLLLDILLSYMAEVNWQELAENAIE